MNKFLVIVVIILIPITLVTSGVESDELMETKTLENVSLEMELDVNNSVNEVENEEKVTEVLVSKEANKSNPFSVDLEEYVVGVVAGEMPASFNMEALKAQAIASRTYALYKMQLNGYVLSATINDQVYLSIDDMKTKWGNEFDYYYARVKEAVESTKGQVITYNDNIIIAYYFAISNGYTDDVKSVFNETREYLISVESPWDKNYQAISSSRIIDKNIFCTKLNITCDKVEISNVVRANNHYVRQITINGKTFTGKDVFQKLALKSMDFTFQVNDNSVVVSTLGFGHGVGMSQYGAQGMANEGYSYKEILTHYYTNTKITEM